MINCGTFHPFDVSKPWEDDLTNYLKSQKITMDVTFGWTRNLPYSLIKHKSHIKLGNNF